MEPQIMPIVSVLMTSYNREDFIGEAIQSVLNSTFKDFELIICDDGSTDKTVEIARSFEKADPRVKVFINPKNLGDYPNRNQAASHATGKYLKYDNWCFIWNSSRRQSGAFVLLIRTETGFILSC